LGHQGPDARDGNEAGGELGDDWISMNRDFLRSSPRESGEANCFAILARE
jgi:hypothetical protein